MKNHFSLRRFGLLFRKHSVEHYKSYLMSLIVLVGIMALVMGYVAYSAGKLDTTLQELFFMLFLVGAGTMFTSTVFSDLGDQKRAIAFLTLPASLLEKYLVAWIYSFLIYVLLYVPAFYLVVTMIINIGGRGTEEAELLKLFGPKGNFDSLIIMYAFLHAVSLVGAVFFRKVHFIKTIFILFLGFFAVIVLNKLLLQTMLGHDNLSAIPLSGATIIEDGQGYKLGVPEADSSFTWIVSIGFILIIWAASYFKLKEKQV
ncbi:hypothetical protein [uncultured Pontibacter sp.]|uniref:hypothetical protein n=1 Tax=uncultured Pontibacter sp. TaxID=453356 RepID=UPI00260589E8|nr:hypothetical protein [uncultured Pontibacter sp.]